ncbi:hypothetical protein B296_00000812 [Ensete ventricosum]|uniref:Uncharacterized protein n=1 Tax=Ensete ventricosum TaxID=4639 RepID=A0A427A3U3_ENSVE|nr:hypothetical protein B296_00000812 [Ensete ventricosum]
MPHPLQPSSLLSSLAFSSPTAAISCTSTRDNVDAPPLPSSSPFAAAVTSCSPRNRALLCCSPNRSSYILNPPLLPMFHLAFLLCTRLSTLLPSKRSAVDTVGHSSQQCLYRLHPPLFPVPIIAVVATPVSPLPSSSPILYCHCGHLPPPPAAPTLPFCLCPP